MKKVLIIGSSKLPCPAVKGGAVPILIEQLLNGYEKSDRTDLDLSCISVFDEKAEALAKANYSKTHFLWIHDSAFSTFMDSLVYRFLRSIKRTRLLNSLSFFFRIQSRKNKIKKILAQQSYDVVIFENSLLVLRIMRSRTLSRKYKGKYYYHSHSVPHFFYGTKAVLKQSAGIISVSEYLSSFFSFAFSSNCHPSNIVVKNCVDLTVFRRNCLRESLLDKFLLPKDAFLLLYVGRLTENKGVLDIVRAMKLLNDKKIFLLACGSSFYKNGSRTEFIQTLFDESNDIKDNIIFTGYVEHKDLPIYYSSCDLLVSPSHCGEAAGLMNIEAMACGLPSITTNDGGIPEYVSDETSCVLRLETEERLPAKLADAVLSLKRDKDRLFKMGEKCLEKASSYDSSYYFDAMFKEILR